jgi:hypothetical protein
MKGRKLATSILKRLLEGSHISEIVFQPLPRLLFTQRKSQRTEIVGQIYLNIESTWKVFDFLPGELPNNEDDFPQISGEEEKKQLFQYLLNQEVLTVELGIKHPHLILNLKNKKIFILNGINFYECWIAGVGNNPKEPCQIIACPGGELAIWEPKTFSV